MVTSTPGKPVVDVAAGRLAGIVEPLGNYYMHPLDISGPPERLPYQASLHPAGELNHARRRSVIPGTSYLAQDGTQMRWTRFDPKRSASARHQRSTASSSAGPDTVLRDQTWDRISEHRC
jgi:hypothetical protein